MNPRAPYGLDLVASCLSCPASESGLFCRLRPRTLAELDANRQMSIHPKGAVLFVAGEAPRGIYVLCAGRAKLTLTSHRGRSVILGIAGRGDVLGLAAVLSNTVHDTDVELLEPAQVNFISRERLLRLFDRHDELKARAAEYLSLELRRMRGQAARLALARSVRGRLAALLLELGRGGRRDREGLRFRLGLTHDELAALAGTSRETVTRLLGGFRRHGLIRMNRGLLTIPDPGRLDAAGE